jgi:hypothetical protein
LRVTPIVVASSAVGCRKADALSEVRDASHGRLELLEVHTEPDLYDHQLGIDTTAPVDRARFQMCGQLQAMEQDSGLCSTYGAEEMTDRRPLEPLGRAFQKIDLRQIPSTSRR